MFHATMKIWFDFSLMFFTRKWRHDRWPFPAMVDFGPHHSRICQLVGGNWDSTFVDESTRTGSDCCLFSRHHGVIITVESGHENTHGVSPWTCVWEWRERTLTLQPGGEYRGSRPSSADAEILGGGGKDSSWPEMEFLQRIELRT
jgi:hypothetical protein